AGLVAGLVAALMAGLVAGLVAGGMAALLGGLVVARGGLVTAGAGAQGLVFGRRGSIVRAVDSPGAVGPFQGGVGGEPGLLFGLLALLLVRSGESSLGVDDHAVAGLQLAAPALV